MVQSPKPVIDVRFWLKELFIAYKFAEKRNYELALKFLRPYCEGILLEIFEDILKDSLWLNPITGRR